MKFTVLGCGSIGKRHIKNLLASGHIVIAWNRSQGRLLEVKNKFNISVYDNLEEILRQPADAVFICTPNSLHIKHAIMAATNKHNLFIEKPLAVDKSHINELAKLVLNHKLILHVACNMRFHPGPKKLKKLLEANQIGKVISSQIWCGAYLPDWHPSEDYKKMYSARKELGGGVLYDLVHEIDLALYLFGKPRRVIGYELNSGYLNIETSEVADLVFNYDYCLVNLHLDYLQRPAQRGIKIIGTKATAKWEMSKNFISITYTDTGKELLLPLDQSDMYVDQQDYFISHLKSHQPTFSDFNSGRNALEIILSVTRQADEEIIMNNNISNFCFHLNCLVGIAMVAGGAIFALGIFFANIGFPILGTSCIASGVITLALSGNSFFAQKNIASTILGAVDTSPSLRTRGYEGEANQYFLQ